MKKTLLAISLIWTLSALVWAAPGNITPVNKAFTGYSSAGGVVRPTAFNDTLIFTGNVAANPATKTLDIPLQTTITGNAGTATALAVNGTNCSGQAATGIDASGNAEGCFTPTGTYSLPTATSSVLGGVKPDGTSIINASGVISATAASVGAAALAGNSAQDFAVKKLTASGSIETNGIGNGALTLNASIDSTSNNAVIQVDEVATLTGCNYAMLYLTDQRATGYSALIIMSNSTPYIVWQSHGLFSGTKDSANTVNVYNETGNIKIQNKYSTWIRIYGTIIKLATN